MAVLPTFDPHGTPGEGTDSYIQGVNARQSWMDREQSRAIAAEQAQRQADLYEIQKPIMQAENASRIAKIGNDLTSQVQMHDLTARAQTEMPQLRQQWIDASTQDDPNVRLQAMEKVLGTAGKYGSLKDVEPEINTWKDVYAKQWQDKWVNSKLTGSSDIAQLKADTARQIAEQKQQHDLVVAQMKAESTAREKAFRDELATQKLAMAQAELDRKKENTANTGQIEYNRERGKAMAAEVATTQAKVTTYTDVLNQTARAREIINSGGEQGRGEWAILEAQKVINTLLPGTFDTSKKEALQMTYGQIALDAAAKIRGQGQVSDAERRLISSTAASFGNTPQGALYIMDFMDAVAKREIALADQYSAMEADGQMVTPAVKLKFYKEHPITEFMGGGTAQPSGPTVIKSIRQISP